MMTIVAMSAGTSRASASVVDADRLVGPADGAGEHHRRVGRRISAAMLEGAAPSCQGRADEIGL